MCESTIELRTKWYRRSVDAAGANTNNFNRMAHEQTIKAITRKEKATIICICVSFKNRMGICECYKNNVFNAQSDTIIDYAQTAGDSRVTATNSTIPIKLEQLAANFNRVES